MHGVRRHLFKLVAAVSLVLCVAAGALWVRSYRVSDGWMWVSDAGTTSAEHRFSFLSHSGQFSVSWNRLLLDPPERRYALSTATFVRTPYGSHILHEARRPPVQFWYRLPDGRTTNWSMLGFAAIENDVHAPAWSVVGVLAGATLLSARPWRWRALRRMRKGLCPNCGYDLRATPERCPECGTEAGAKKGTSRISRDDARHVPTAE
jgi:hypothetical protein